MAARSLAFLALLAMLVPGRARAQGAADTEPIRIAFHAFHVGAGCPDQAAFAAQVTARTQRARLAEAGETARTFTVTVTTAGARTRGTLTIDDPGGAPATRTVSGGTCEEVVSALGLIAALAIDPHASTAPTPPPLPPSPPPPPPPPPRPILLDRPPPPLLYDAVPWGGEIAAPLPVIPEPPEPPRWRFGVVARGGGMFGAPASSLPAFGGSFEVALQGAGVLSPSFRLGYTGGASGIVDLDATHAARFTLHLVRAEGCPVRVAFLPVLALVPCVTFDAGALLADGYYRGGAPGQPQALTAAWVAPGAAARLQWDVWRWLWVEVDGGLNVPLLRYNYLDKTGPSTVGTASPVVGLFAGGVGAHFP